MGYALVEVPRTLWNNSKKGYTLEYSYFKVAALSLEKGEAEENVNELLEVSKISFEFATNLTHKYFNRLLLSSLIIIIIFNDSVWVT